MTTPQDNVTQILQALANGEPGSADRLLPAVYDELHAIARHVFRDQPAAQTLQPTALVHEAYIRLVGDAEGPRFECRAHFMAVAAKAMRHILVDQARRRRAAKRGGGAQRITLHETSLGDTTDEVDVLALDDALERLAEMDERKAKIVELRFFGGLSIDETAEALSIARSTVTEDWRMARAWLACELGADDES